MITSTSKFNVHDIVYDKDGFAIARGYWEKDSTLSLACRWHDDGVGYPQTFGKPQWMLFPKDIKLEVISTLLPSESRIHLTLG